MNTNIVKLTALQSAADSMLRTSVLPLLFSFKQVVVGNGFFAGVEMNGRALLETDPEDGGEWITGIAPVGISGGGGDRAAAFGEFRKAWTLVVFDLAEQAKDFQEFKALCVKFLSSAQPNMTKLWGDAVTAVRKSGAQQAARSSSPSCAMQHNPYDRT